MLVRWQTALTIIILSVISGMYFLNGTIKIDSINANFSSMKFKIMHALFLVRVY